MKITNQDAADIAITAAEGGIGYWSIITSTYDPVSSDDWGHGTRDPFYTIRQQDEVTGDEFGPTYFVNAPAIRRGVDLFPEVLKRQFPLDDYDASDADVVVQLAAFGKLVYG